MRYTYFISFAASFKPEVNEQGTPNHNWCKMNGVYTFSERVRSASEVFLISKGLHEKHGADFIIIDNIALLNKEWFKPALKIEEYDFKGVQVLRDKEDYKQQ